MLDSYCSNWVMSSKLIVQEAKKMGLEVKIIEKNKNFYSVSNENKKVYFKANDCGIDSSIGMKIADNKEFTYIVCEENNIKIPKTVYLNRNDLETFNYKVDINYPVITKPVNGGHGDGVALNINSKEELKAGIIYSFQNPKTTKIVIQEQIIGDDYRLIIIGGKFVACAKRVPPFVIGNGLHSILELIENNNNQEGISKNDHDGIKNKIKVDSELERCISRKGYDIKSILGEGIKLYVRDNGNLSTGGFSIDATESVNKELINESILFSNILGLGLAGVDVITSDITKSLKETSGAIIEINNTPGLKMHHFPSEGKPINVAKKLLTFIFS